MGKRRPNPRTLRGALRCLDEFSPPRLHEFSLEHELLYKAVCWLSSNLEGLSWAKHIAPRFHAFRAVLLKFDVRAPDLNGWNEYMADTLKAKTPPVKRAALAVDVLNLMEQADRCNVPYSAAHMAMRDLAASTTPSARNWERLRRDVLTRGIVEFWRVQTAHLPVSYTHLRAHET